MGERGAEGERELLEGLWVAEDGEEIEGNAAVEGERLERVMNLEADEKGITCDELRELWTRGCSLRTFVTADDVAAMILFLCSEQGARISGQAIGVDGHTEFI